MTSLSLQLNISQKDILDDCLDEIKQIQWETGEYVFHDFIEYFQLPQIVRIRQPWDTNLLKDDILYLHGSYDRHLIIGKSLTHDERIFLLPDWFQDRCRVLTVNPIFKARWWEFHNAVELLRFQVPRSHIRLLSNTPALLRLPMNQTIRVMLKENIEFTLKSVEKSTISTDAKEMFVFKDKNDQEFLFDPTETDGVFHFAIKILDEEFDQSYHGHNQETLFSLPEILIRYELPIDIEFVSSASSVPIAHFPSKLRLEKYSIAKSIIAFSIGDCNHPRILEFSALTQFSLQCIKCLTTGLPRDISVYEDTQPFDESAYRHYETIRERLVQLFEEIAAQYIRAPFIGTREEIESIGKVYEIGKQMKNEENEQSYILFDQINDLKNQETLKATPSIDKHPNRFTVHLPADLNHPYSSVMEIDEDQEDQPIES